MYGNLYLDLVDNKNKNDAYKKLTYLLVTILGFSVIMFCACSKTDFEKHSHEADINVLFFQKTKPVTAQIQKLYDGLKKQNGIYSFVNNLPKHSGYPVWDKVQFFNKKKTNVAARGGETGEEEAVAYIPMSEDEEYISSLLKVEETEDSIYTYSVEIYTNDFFYEMMLSENITAEQANYLLGLFMYMDYETFGATEFENIPKNAFEGEAKFDSILTETFDVKINTVSKSSQCVEVKWLSVYCGTPKWCNDHYGMCDAWFKDCPDGSCWIVDNRWAACGGGGGGSGTGGEVPGVVVPTNPNGPPSTGPYGGGGGTSTGTNPDKNPPCGGAWYRVKECADVNGYYPSRIEELNSLIGDNPNFLVSPCDYLNQYLDITNHKAPQSVLDRVELIDIRYNNGNGPMWVGEPNAYIQDIDDASSALINFDYFPVKISQMPKDSSGNSMTPSSLFEYFRLNWNKFIDTTLAEFHPYKDNYWDDTNLWNSNNALGAMLHLKMIDDGTVIVTKHNHNSNFAQLYVKTLRTPLDGEHPVSGTRSWGIISDNNGEYCFYTSAADRITGALQTVANTWADRFGIYSGFDRADDLWRSLQDKMIDFINNNGGSARRYSTPEYILRPEWEDIDDFLKKKITMNELKQRIGC